MRRTVVVVMAVAALVAVMALRSCAPSDTSEPTDADRSRAPAVPPPDEVGPRGTERGVPVGWSRDRHGARVAAVSAVAMTGEIARAGFITRSDMIVVLASSRFGPTLAQESSSQLDELFGDLATEDVAPSSVLFQELPLTAEVLHADAERAEVAVWAVVVVGVPEHGAPRQLWRTVTVDLVWEHDDWRVDGWTTAAGPTPALATNAPIATVEDLATVTAWPPAAGGE